MAQVPTPKPTNYAFGIAQEEALKSRIQSALGEPIQKTLPRYAQMDFYSEHHYIELKSRRSPILPESYDTWLLPTCKGPRDDHKETVYFYYFEADDSLWYLLYDEEQFATYKRAIPYWHPTRQEHFYIPKSEFTRL